MPMLKQVLAVVLSIAAIGAAGCARTSPGPVVVDGFFTDWPADALSVSDPVGDASGPTDLVSLAAQRMGNNVYLRLKTSQAANLHKWTGDDGLRLEIAGDDGRVTIDPGRRRVERDGQAVPWSEVAYVGLPTHAATEFELRLRAPGDALTVAVTGSDTLDRTLQIPAAAPALPPRHVDVSRGAAPLRIVVWNVLRGGPFDDPDRLAAGRDVLRKLDPDVLLLQEVWGIAEFEQRVREVCGQDWTVHEAGGVAVASRLPLTLLEVGPDVELDDRRRPKGGDTWSVMRNLFVGVDTPLGPLVVVSAHWKCCGALGTTEDIRRMDDALVTLKAIWRLRDAGVPATPRRDGSLPYKAPVPERFSAAPLLIAGDYNLVGSRAPLDMLLTHGLVDLVPVQSDEWSAATWRSLGDERIARGEPVPSDWEPGGYPPGRLDLALVDQRINVTRAFIADLGAATLVSDHLPIVVDVGE